ncbi:putative fructose-bisphosphate aldolase [Colletotrichum spaethianum]|uniref:Fructose-bisphosphate aldolase n=1 Tax=Colletotrichum spaethianum TaxID=700344 RepID=A0AA37NYT0_9PEZI|nr:putative fructose-bisphosphate aldolase [Colletotrichum spaethianum]GKT41468.1 putative fructose-bisphosphate aldolase [Colletotrichum spaethianum]
MSAPPNWRDNNRTIQILKKAERERYGVIAAIAYNLEQIHGLVTAAVEARSPLVIQFFPWQLPLPMACLSELLKTPCLGSLCQYQFTLITPKMKSIMVDMSHYEKKENLEKTATWVRYCHERGIATEAEPGRIEGAEDGVMDTAGLEASKTMPEEVTEFIATGVDSLAPAFGNVHGEYGKQGPQLDFERFERIRLQIDGRVSVALHGTNGFPPDLMKQCISAGATKINVNKLVLDDYYTHLKSQVTQLPHTTLIEEGTSKVIRQTKEWMEICGSAGKALTESLLDV